MTTASHGARLGDQLTVTDLFCGAGGSSLGAVRAGAELRMAANHWQAAIETHSTNFPDAAHDCADISQVEPRRYPRTDVLLASPECTHHSQARSHKHVPDLFDPNGDPSAERSRATMWDVVRFTEVHRYQAVIVENVIEVRKWPPFDAWLQAMDSLGYEHQLVFLNSMVAWPTPQSRDRLYVVFWRKGNRRPDLNFRPPCWCSNDERTIEGVQTWKRPDRPGGRYRQQYLYRCGTCGGEAQPLVYPAASIIDWSLPCPRIGDRKRPLRPASRRRVEVGLQRFGPALLAQMAGHTFERPGYARAWPIIDPMPTQTATLQHGLVVDLAYGGTSDLSKVRWTALPLPTQTGRATLALAIPVRTNSRARDVDGDVLATLTTGHGASQALVELPAFLVRAYGDETEAHYRSHPVAAPLGSITAQGDSHQLVTLPFMASLRGGGDREQARGVTEPAATFTASGNHHALVVPPGFIVKAYGDGTDASMQKPLAEPLGAVTGVDHHQLVALPFTVDYHGTGRASTVAQPMPTQDTRDRHALVDPAIDVDDCGLRMLEPAEVQGGMGFPVDYAVLGTKRTKVKLLGNAVTPPAMTMLTDRVIESLA